MEGIALVALINGLFDLVVRLIATYASHPSADPTEIAKMQERLDQTAKNVAAMKPVPPPAPPIV